MIEKTVKADGH